MRSFCAGWSAVFSSELTPPASVMVAPEGIVSAPLPPIVPPVQVIAFAPRLRSAERRVGTQRRLRGLTERRAERLMVIDHAGRVDRQGAALRISVRAAAA